MKSNLNKNINKNHVEIANEILNWAGLDLEKIIENKQVFYRINPITLKFMNDLADSKDCEKIINSNTDLGDKLFNFVELRKSFDKS